MSIWYWYQIISMVYRKNKDHKKWNEFYQLDWIQQFSTQDLSLAECSLVWLIFFLTSPNVLIFKKINIFTTKFFTCFGYRTSILWRIILNVHRGVVHCIYILRIVLNKFILKNFKIFKLKVTPTWNCRLVFSLPVCTIKKKRRKSVSRFQSTSRHAYWFP